MKPYEYKSNNIQYLWFCMIFEYFQVCFIFVGYKKYLMPSNQLNSLKYYLKSEGAV